MPKRFEKCWRWTPEEDQALRENCGQGYAILEEKLPNRTKRAISNRAHGLGLIVCPDFTSVMRERMRKTAKASIAVTSGNGAAWRWLKDHVGYRGEGCLIWPFTTTRPDTPRKQHAAGYGMLGYRGRQYKAGVLMCQMVNGSKPTPKHRAGYVCARGSEGCVHPQHLKWMTPSEISTVAWRDPERVQRPNTRYTYDETRIAEIRSSKGTQIEIAARYGMHPAHVGKIIRREAWASGIRMRWGFKAGDPNNPSRLRARGLLAAARKPHRMPTNEEAREHMARAERLVPQGIVDRDHIVSDIVMALMCGASPGSIRWQDFRAKVYRENFEPGKAAFQTDDAEAYAFERYAFEQAIHADDLSDAL